MTDNTDDSLAERVERLHAALEATEERPVEPAASRWIGEAQAVAGDAGDIAASGGTDAVVRERVSHVAELLSNVEETGDEAADERVATAKSLAEQIAAGE